jgi:hypothetical protein
LKLWKSVSVAAETISATQVSTNITTLKIGPTAILDPMTQCNALSILHQTLPTIEFEKFSPSVRLAIFSVCVYMAFKGASYM